MSADVLPVVEDLAYAGSRGFRASVVASQLGASDDEVRLALMRLVGSGELTLKFDLICPDNGRTIRRYSVEEELPIGEMESDTKCETDEPFCVEKRHIWVTFEPALEFLQQVNRKRAGEDKKKLTAPGPVQLGGSRDAPDELAVYERSQLIKQTHGDQYFYGCSVNLHQNQVAATGGSAVADSGGTAATSGGQAASGGGAIATDQATALGSGSVQSLASRVKKSKISMIAGSLGIISIVATMVLFVTGKTDLGVAGFALTVIAAVLAVVPLMRREG
jgi:hypothetical protein